MVRDNESLIFIVVLSYSKRSPKHMLTNFFIDTNPLVVEIEALLPAAKLTKMNNKSLRNKTLLKKKISNYLFEYSIDLTEVFIEKNNFLKKIKIYIY